jgi:bacillithiol biosynthesis deacetylase BshB1
MKAVKKIDVLAFGAHPDDVEACAAGLLIKAKKQGYTTGIIDLTHGEGSNFGSKKERDQEAQKAAKLLKLDLRENLNIPDLQVQPTDANVAKVAAVIRKYRPDVVLAPYYEDLHPDHAKTGKIVEKAAFFAKIRKYRTKKISEPHQVGTLMYYMLHTEFKSSFILDISEEYPLRLKSLLAHASQFYKQVGGKYTEDLHNPDFNRFFEARSIVYGYKIGAAYGEPYLIKGYLGLKDINSVMSGDLRSLSYWKAGKK